MPIDLFAQQDGAQGQQQQATGKDLFEGMQVQPQQQQGQQAAVQQPQVQAQQQPSAFMDGLEAFNRQFGRMAEGTLQLIGKATGSQGLEDSVKAVHDAHESSLKQAELRSPIATTIGDLTGAVASGVAYGGGAAGLGKGLAAKMATGALGTAGQNFLQYADTEGERALKTGIGAGVGAAIPVIGKGISSVVNAFLPEKTASGFLSKALNSEKAAATDAGYLATKGGTEGLENTVANAEKAGINLTLGQATGNKAILAKEAQLGTTDMSKGAVLETIQNQETAGKRVITGVLDNLVPTGTKAAEEVKDKLYSQIGKVTVGEDVMDVIKNDESLMSRLTKINTATDSVVKNLPDNSLIKIDALKKNLDDTLWNDTFQMVDPSKKLSGDAKQAILNARSKLMDSLEGYTGYGDARKLAQQLTIQNRYNTLLDKAPNADKSVKEYYKTLFNTPEKQKYFLEDVASTGGDVDATKGLIDVLGKIKNSTLDKALGSTAGGATQFAGKEGAIEKMLSNAFFGKYKDSMQELLLNSAKWAPAIDKILNQKTTTGMVSKLVNVLGNVKDSGAIQQGARIGVGKEITGYLSK